MVTKAYKKLTEKEKEKELENLLRNCKDEKEFDKECRHRFGEPQITVTWTRNIRMASILLEGRKKSIHASVTIS